MVFPEADYDSDAFQLSDNGKYTFTHKAIGADMFRYSWNWGRNWTEWASWEDVTEMDSSLFQGKDMFWEGAHVMVQCGCLFFYFLELLVMCSSYFFKIGLRLPYLHTQLSMLILDTSTNDVYPNSLSVVLSTRGVSTRG